MLVLMLFKVTSGPQAAEPSEKYLRMLSSSRISPSSISIMIPMAVNCLPTEPDWKIVSGFTGTSNSTLAKPYARTRSIRPSL